MGKHYKHSIFSRVLIVIFSLICLGVVAITTKNMILEQKENKEIKETSNVLKNIKVECIEENNTSQRSLKIRELRKEWDDVVGWLEISGTRINYPVCQSNDNNFYLNHTFKKEKNKSGSLFLDANNCVERNGGNLIIYGHRNKYGLMFEDLIKYKDIDFWRQNKIIRFTTEIRDEKYEIFAVIKTKVYYQDEKGVFKYYNYSNIKNKTQYDEYITEIKKLSLYDTEIDVKYNDEIITLSTCEYSQKNGRFVVVGRRIKE